MHLTLIDNVSQGARQISTCNRPGASTALAYCKPLLLQETCQAVLQAAMLKKFHNSKNQDSANTALATAVTTLGLRCLQHSLFWRGHLDQAGCLPCGVVLLDGTLGLPQRRGQLLSRVGLILGHPLVDSEEAEGVLRATTCLGGCAMTKESRFRQ